MAEEFKFYIKFVGMLIIFLILFLVVLGDMGIASNVFNYLTYIEPILLQDYISSALIVGSTAPGEFSSNIRTSGQPHTIEILTNRDDNIIYVSVKPDQETYMETKFATIDPTPIVTNCIIPDQKIKLQKNIMQIITIKKTSSNGGCKLFVIA